MPKPTLVTTPDPSDAPKPPTLPTTRLPTNQHTDFSNVYQAETLTRLAAFDTNIAALQGEIEGQHETFVAETEKLRVEFERQTAALTTDHNSSKADLLRRLVDVQLGKAMAEAALDVWNNGKEGEPK